MKKTVKLLCGMMLMLTLAACGSGEAGQVDGYEEAAPSELEVQLAAQFGLLEDHITAAERQDTLHLLEEIDVLKEERLQQGEYEKSSREKKLLKELNGLYDTYTQQYLIEQEAQEPEEGPAEAAPDAGEPVEEEPDAGELNAEVSDVPTLAAYEVEEDGALHLAGGGLSDQCPWTDEKIKTVWQEIMYILPDAAGEYFVELQLFTDGKEEMLAYVEQADDHGAEWTLAIDPADYEDEDMFMEAVVHEFFHCVSLNDEQVLYTDEPDIDEYTEEYEKGAYCIYPEGSYVADFYEAFWIDYIDDREIDPENEYFYLRHEEDFVTDYAATIPAEDICESFAYFVLYDKGVGDAVWQQKIDFFYDYPELVDYRKEIRENLGLQPALH